MRRMLAAVGILVAVLLALSQVPASAVFEPGPPPTGRRALRRRSRPGRRQARCLCPAPGRAPGSTGGSARRGSPAAPTRPTQRCLPDFASAPESFAGIIFGTPTEGGDPLSLYCIDIRTLTQVGVGYNLGDWDDSNVPNVGYVAYILNNYYPRTHAAGRVGRRQPTRRGGTGRRSGTSATTTC